MELTLSVRSFQVPATPGTTACPPAQLRVVAQPGQQLHAVLAQALEVQQEHVVALAAQVVEAGLVLAQAAVDLDEGVDVDGVAAAAEALLDAVGILADEADVQHGRLRLLG